MNDSVAGAVTIRLDGESQPLPSTMYTVTPANPTSTDDLTITLGANFPVTSKQLFISLNVMYGPGRGLSRRPDSIHSVAFINPSTELLVQ